MFSEMRRGVLTALPVLLGIFPLGVILGAQAAHVGQAPITTLLMTGINLAGGSEFAALALWSAVPPILMIVISTFLINSRHIVLGTALAPYVRHEGGFRIALIYFLMCDETWALSMQDIQRRNLEAKPFAFHFYLGVGLALWICWWFSCFLGAAIGSSIGDLNKLGFSIAMPATFIALAIAMRPKKKINYIPIAMSFAASALTSSIGDLNKLGFSIAMPATFIALAIAMRPKKKINYIPIAMSFAASALTAKYGNSSYCVGAGVLAGLIGAYIIRVYQEKAGLIATQGDLKEVDLSSDTAKAQATVDTENDKASDTKGYAKASDAEGNAQSTDTAASPHNAKQANGLDDKEAQ